GADVTIPLDHFITNATPELMKGLQDDIRAVPEGITNNEAKEFAERPPLPPVVDETIPVVRGANGMEPLFSIGDRKLTLNKIQPEGEAHPAFANFHDFDMLNEHGQSVGTINLSEQKGGKALYIEMVNGLGEYYNPNNFGPALMRSLLRQIKEQFPNAETLTGHRVSGARETAGSM